MCWGFSDPGSLPTEMTKFWLALSVWLSSISLEEKTGICSPAIVSQPTMLLKNRSAEDVGKVGFIW